MAGKGWWVAAFILVVGAVPHAGAVDARGSFAVAGEMQVPQGASFEGEPIAFLRWALEGAEPLGIDDLSMRADSVIVHRYWAQGVSLNSPLVPHDGVAVTTSQGVDTYALHNVRLTLLAEQPSAYVAVEARPGGAFSFHSAWKAPTFAARNETILSSTGEPQPAGAADVHYYQRVLTREHLLLTGPGRVHHEGPATIKLFGLDLRLEADENTTDLRTGVGPDQAADLGVGRWDWVVLEAQALTLDAASRGPWEMTAEAAALRWDGKAVFRCLQGEMRTDEGRYLASPRPIVIDGAFEGTIRPEGQGRDVHTRLDVVGDLSTTSMEAASDAVVPREGAARVLPWLGVGMGIAATGAGGVFAWRRRPRAPGHTAEPTAESCMAKVHEHIQVGQPQDALRWVVQARRLAPTSASACATHAFLLGEVGRVDEALVAYQEASRLAPGEAEYALDAARLAHAAGKPPQQVEDLLEQALARAPSQVEELERDGYFDALASRPRYEHMVEQAWRRFMGDLSGPDRE